MRQIGPGLLFLFLCVLAPSAAADAVTDELDRARDLRKKWRLTAAERVLEGVLAEDPTNVRALLDLAVITALRRDYVDALSWLKRARKTGEEPEDVLLGFAWLYRIAAAPAISQGYYRKVMAKVKKKEHLLLQIARTEMAMHMFARAEAGLKALLKKGYDKPDVLAALARVHMERKDFKRAEELSTKALMEEPENVNAMSVLVGVRMEQRRTEAVVRLCFRMVELNPYDFGTRRVLAAYIHEPSPRQTDADSRREYRLARRSAENGKPRDAYRRLHRLLGEKQDYLEAILLLGGVCLTLKKHEEAIKLGRRAVAAAPKNSLTQVLLTQAYLAKHHVQRVLIGATDHRLRYRECSRRRVKGASVVFPEYDSLAPEEKLVINNALWPVRHLIPALRGRGSSHRLLPLHKRLTDYSVYQYLETRKTFDGRPWPSVRGASGELTVSGIETVWRTLRGGFSTVAHEVGHQIYNNALNQSTPSPSRRAGGRGRVIQLYDAAVAENRTLDNYSRNSASEYFAQSYEAFVAPFKRPGTGLRERNTRARLKKMDPEMFAFLKKITRE